MFDFAMLLLLCFAQDIAQDRERDGHAAQVNGYHRDEETNRDGVEEAEPADGMYPPLRSEDSGLGISASPSEQHLPPLMGLGTEGSEIYREGEGVWRRGGSVDTMTKCLQDILAFITTR